MSYEYPTSDEGKLRFHPGETLSAALSRVTLEQFDIALGLARVTSADRALAVHATRKAIKRLRAMLRLVRDSLPGSRYHTDNEVLKLVAAELGSIRDSWVMAETLDSLFGESAPPSVDVLRSRLRERYQVDAEVLLDNRPHIASIVEQLENVKKRSRTWASGGGDESPLPHAFSSIDLGLERVYRRGLKAMHNVFSSPTDALLHNWRKRAKYLRHQIEALNVLDPAALGRLEEGFETLTDLLGDDHDLTVLSHRLATDRKLRHNLEVEPIFDAIGEQRHHLQAEATELGTDLYAASPAAFLARLESLWPKGPTF